MSLKDVFDKGKSFIDKGTESVKTYGAQKKEARSTFEILKTNSSHLQNFLPFEVHNQNVSDGKEQMILECGLTVNVPEANSINELIPINETILDVKSSKEAKTEIKYWFIVTDKKLWIANSKEYKTYEFSEITKCEIIDKGFMCFYVNFNNNAFVIDGNEKDVINFCNLLTNVSFRQEISNKRCAYLCGVEPKEQYLNMYKAGLTVGTNNTLVFHNGKGENKLTELTNILYLQLLLDNTVVMSKGKPDMQSMVSASYDCRKMSIKVVLKDGDFVFDILPNNIMNTSYKKEDATYIKNYEFGKQIINYVADMLKPY